MIARSKLNSIESKISKALMNNELVMKTLNSHRSDAEKVSLIEEGKK